MKDIPLFTTENGIASLVFKEIPYTGKAYIRIQDSVEPEKLLAECRDFCRSAGAEEVFATGHVYLERFKRHARILRMRGDIENIGDTDAAIFPVTDKTIDEFSRIYNNAMANIPNTSYMTSTACKEILEKGTGYFVHCGDQLLGIGIAGGGVIEAVVSLISGEGKRVVQALTHALSENIVELEVAEENVRAMRLYKKLQFIPVEEISVWYKIY